MLLAWFMFDLLQDDCKHIGEHPSPFKGERLGRTVCNGTRFGVYKKL